MFFKIKKGLDLPLAGRPEQVIHESNDVRSVALLGSDAIGLRPSMVVAVGDRVRLGQLLFTDKRNPGVHFTAPGAGIVSAINRGERRVLQSVTIQLDGDEEESFVAYSSDRIAGLHADEVRQNLLASGLWTAFRTRPFSNIPKQDSSPSAIFVTAIDTNPLAADPAVIIAMEADAFGNGLHAVSRLTNGQVYVCTAPGAPIDCPDNDPFRRAEFSGRHPAGLVGTHIHCLEPVSEAKTVWHISYQDVIAIGKVFATGRLAVERIVALAGPPVKHPRLIRTRLGANIQDLIANELKDGEMRIISGSVLSGHRASGWAAWLGRYHTQISILREGRERHFLDWLMPGLNKFSFERTYAGRLLNRSEFAMTTSQHGSPRAMVSIGSFEKVLPLDILATPLLKALLVGDTDTAKALGCLELDEEDLALCSFVCNGKYEYGPELRSNLNAIEANG